MPVDTPHNSFKKHESQWKEVRDAMAGEEAVKNEGVRYLPKLSGQNTEDYQAYKTRAMFYGATGRTHNGLMGAMFRKDPTYALPNRISGLEESTDNGGTPLNMFAQLVAAEVLGVGRLGLLTDLPEASGETPYLVVYQAEQITNWRVRVINDKPTLEQVILFEVSEEPAEDGFGSKIVERFRVLDLVALGQSVRLVYRVQIYEKTDDKSDEWEMTEEKFPTRRGENLDFIPFTFIGPHGLKPAIAKAPLYDLAVVNMSHYRTSADLEHGCHWTALPTPWVSGLREETTTLHIGSQTAWTLPAGAQAGMLEFSGAGLSALEKRLIEKQQLMARLGARLLEDQKRAAETAESKRLDYSGDNSVLSSVANSVSEGMRRNLNWANLWAGGNEDEVEFEANRDFFDDQLEPAEMVQLVATWQSGGLPKEALFWNLKQGERLPPDMTFEEYERQLEEEGPPLGGTDNSEPDDTDEDEDEEET